MAVLAASRPGREALEPGRCARRGCWPLLDLGSALGNSFGSYQRGQYPREWSVNMRLGIGDRAGTLLLLASLLASALAAPSCGGGEDKAPPATRPAGAGFLEGRATIGPLTPVERPGVATPTPSAETCTSRGLTVYEQDGVTEVISFQLRPDCTYRVALPPGTYVVRLKETPGVGGSKDLPRTVRIESGETNRLDISIDTGIR